MKNEEYKIGHGRFLDNLINPGKKYPITGYAFDRGTVGRRSNGEHDDATASRILKHLDIIYLIPGRASPEDFRVNNNRVHTRLDNNNRRIRKPPGYGLGYAASKAPNNNELLRRLPRPRRHAGSDVRYDLQRQRPGNRSLGLRLLHVRRVEFTRRILQHELDPPPDVHLIGPLLRDSQTPKVPDNNDQAGSRPDAPCLLDIPSAYILPTDIQRVVYDPEERPAPSCEPRPLRFQGEQELRYPIVQHIILDPLHDHDDNILRNIPGGEQTGETDAQSYGKRDVVEPQTKQGHEQYERGIEQRWVFEDPDIERGQHGPSPHTDEGQEDDEHEEGAQGREDPRDHNGNVHTVLASVFLVVRDDESLRKLRLPGHSRCHTILDRLHELGLKSADIRVLQQRLSGGLQEHIAVRILFAMQTRTIRSRSAGLPTTVAKVRRSDEEHLLRDIHEAHRP